MAFKRVDMRGPEAPEPREPLVNFHQGLGPDAIDAPLRIDARFDKPGVAQDTQMLGDHGLRHPQPLLDFLYGALRGRQETQDGATVRLGDNRKS